jgi:hypothetical protein
VQLAEQVRVAVPQRPSAVVHHIESGWPALQAGQPPPSALDQPQPFAWHVDVRVKVAPQVLAPQESC